MSEPILVPAGGGEIIRDEPDRQVEILSDGETLVATWWRFGPGRDGADLHVHRLHSDLFYVLQGELAVRLGIEDEAVVAPAGTLVHLPPLVVHGFRNGSEADSRFLNFHAPGSQFADYMRAWRDGRSFPFDQHPPPPDGGRATSDAVVGGDSFAVDSPGLRMALLGDVDEIGVAEVWSDPDSPSAAAHVHRRHVESFYVLEGELSFAVRGRELRAQVGSWVQVPPGAPHTFTAAGDGRVRFLNLHTPSCGFGVFVRALHETGSDLESAAARAAFDQEPA